MNHGAFVIDLGDWLFEPLGPNAVAGRPREFANLRVDEAPLGMLVQHFPTPPMEWARWPAEEMARRVRQGEPDEVGIPHGVGYLWTDGVCDVFTAFVRGAAGSALKVEVYRASVGVEWPLSFAEHALALFGTVQWPEENPSRGQLGSCVANDEE